MKFDNATPFPAFLHRQAIAGDRIAAAAIVRATFSVGTPCMPSRTQPWGVSPIDWTAPCGHMPSDDLFDREGCDLLLLGHAETAGDEPVPALDVAIAIGDFRASVRVFGDRRWVRDGDRLVSTPPQPFRNMPLDIERAYGGVSSYDELPVPFGDNPRGRGFYLEREQAEDRPLPNIEDPEALIHSWDDRPEPVGVGLCPLGFPPRVRASAVIRDGRVVGVKRSIHNQAFPKLVCPHVAPGAAVTVQGMGPALSFRVPTEPIFAVARVGESEHRDPLRIDQLGIEPARKRFFITYRYTFIYPIRSGEIRSCKLQWAPPAGLAISARSSEVHP